MGGPVAYIIERCGLYRCNVGRRAAIVEFLEVLRPHVLITSCRTANSAASIFPAEGVNRTLEVQSVSTVASAAEAEPVPLFDVLLAHVALLLVRIGIICLFHDRNCGPSSDLWGLEHMRL